MKGSSTEESEKIKNGDLYTILRNGKNIISRDEIRAPEGEEICKENMELIGNEAIKEKNLKFEYVGQLSGVQELEEVDVNLEFYPFYLEGVDLGALEETVRAENDPIHVKIGEFLEKKKAEFLKLEDFEIDAEKTIESMNEKRKHVNENLTKFCEKFRFDQGTWHP